MYKLDVETEGVPPRTTLGVSLVKLASTSSKKCKTFLLYNIKDLGLLYYCR